PRTSTCPCSRERRRCPRCGTSSATCEHSRYAQVQCRFWLASTRCLAFGSWTEPSREMGNCYGAPRLDPVHRSMSSLVDFCGSSVEAGRVRQGALVTVSGCC